MGKVHPAIDDRLRKFIERQRLFFVATAPSGSGGHVNLSPKGIAGTFAVVDAHTVAYLDITASGAETIAHLRDNGRITVMFCSFDRKPNIVRLHGRGRVVSGSWNRMLPPDEDLEESSGGVQGCDGSRRASSPCESVSSWNGPLPCGGSSSGPTHRSSSSLRLPRRSNLAGSLPQQTFRIHDYVESPA